MVLRHLFFQKYNCCQQKNFNYNSNSSSLAVGRFLFFLSNLLRNSSAIKAHLSLICRKDKFTFERLWIFDGANLMQTLFFKIIQLLVCWNCCCWVVKLWGIHPARRPTRLGRITPLFFVPLSFFILFYLPLYFLF